MIVDEARWRADGGDGSAEAFGDGGTPGARGRPSPDPHLVKREVTGDPCRISLSGLGCPVMTSDWPNSQDELVLALANR
jgi:hypothetical protein